MSAQLRETIHLCMCKIHWYFLNTYMVVEDKPKSLYMAQITLTAAKTYGISAQSSQKFCPVKKKNRKVPNQWFQPQKIFKFYNKKRDILHQTLGLVFLSLTLKCFNSHFLPSTYLQAPKNSLKNSWNKPKTHLRKTNKMRLSL